MQDARRLLYLTYFIYFFCGMTQCFEGAFLPEFKQYFDLSYQQQMYTMFAKNIPFLLAVVIGYFVRSIGYRNCLTIAMALYAGGTLLLVPGLQLGRYELLLLGFFLIGSGFNFQLVAGNPLLCALGPEEESSSRLNFGNALGAVAQIIAPATITLIVPATAVAVQSKLPYMQGLFLVLGGALVALAIATLLPAKVDVSGSFARPAMAEARQSGILKNSRLMLGFAAIFLVLGVEAGLFGLYRNYLEDPAIAGLSATQSQRLFTVYFAVFALGRLAGSWVQRRVQPALHLGINAVAAMACLGVILVGHGMAAIFAVTAIGFFVSIFFPTIYALAIEGMGDQTGQASGLLTMGFVGCAVIPVLQGMLADLVGLQRSYMLGFAAYLLAGFFALRTYRTNSC